MEPLCAHSSLTIDDTSKTILYSTATALGTSLCSTRDSTFVETTNARWHPLLVPRSGSQLLHIIVVDIDYTSADS